ncbi:MULTISPECIES: signal peptidase I [Kytococcus]|uniref:signal peptidase I n=1 Tax=Kytococcus TaxID=57499 RepID=UPI001EDA3CC9|nr:MULTISPECIES: signal peptidase I [Kytococcus]
MNTEEQSMPPEQHEPNHAADDQPATGSTSLEADPATPGEPVKERGGFLSALRETVVVAALALFFAFLIKTFLVQAFFIPSGSMENTLQEGDRLLVNKLSPTPFAVERGEVVVFQDPGQWLGSTPKDKSLLHKAGQFVGVLPGDGDEYLIKRVIGLPGDRVQCCDAEGRVQVNGKSIDEPYVFPGNPPSLVEFDEKVPEDHLWVMGDHRSNSGDSRYHGTVPMDRVTGGAFVVIWPFDHVGTLPGKDVFADVPDPK